MTNLKKNNKTVLKKAVLAELLQDLSNNLGGALTCSKAISNLKERDFVIDFTHNDVGVFQRAGLVAGVKMQGSGSIVSCASLGMLLLFSRHKDNERLRDLLIELECGSTD